MGLLLFKAVCWAVETGLLASDDLVTANTRMLISEEVARRFAHYLGFGYTKFSKGSFNDMHESVDNQDDRHTRFLPRYMQLWLRAPSKLPTDPSLSVDDVDDCKLRSHRVSVTGSDSVVRQIDLGGVPPADGDIVMLASHDECYFKAGEYASSGWLQEGKQKCVEKTDGPSLHVSAFLWSLATV